MAITGTMATDPSQLAGLNPGANPTGAPVAGLSSPISTAAPALGGSENPFIPAPTTGTTMPAYSSPYSPTGATAGLLGTDPSQAGGSLFGRPTGMATQNELAQSFQKAGTMPGGLGTAAAQFMQSGAGYNPVVANALIAAMQPQIAKGQANLMEQFGATGQAMGSPSALALGDYMAQTNLDVGQLLSGLYEQSVQNYINVLGMGHVNVSQQTQQGGGIMGALGSLLGGIAPNIGPAIGAGASGLPGWASILLGA